MPFLLMLKAKANVLLLQKSSQINNKFKRDTWEGRGIQRSPREKVETPPIRWLPILPALFALVALILASLCLLAGSRPGYMGDYAILTLNISSVGINLFKTSPYAKGTQQNNPLSTLINPLLSTSQSAFNQLTTFIAKKLGLQDYYSIHMMDYCFGSYNLHSTSIGTTVSGCSTRTVLFAFDPMPILQKALDKAGIGIAVEQLNWPQALQDGISQLKLIAHIAFATYSLAISLCFCTIIACGYWMSPYSHGSRRIVALTLTISGAAFGSLMCASVMVTILMEKGEFHAGKYGRLMGITVFRGNGYLGLTWAAMLMALAGMVTVGGECCRRRNRMAFRVFFEK